MSGVMMMIIAIVVLGGAYLLYGRYLQNKWGIDPNAKTPAYEMEDGVDYVPADTNVVFGHQFASIAGAGPINGPIQAAIFGWLPVLLWILIGGVFFGAVQDFASMYASVKNKGRTIGYIIEEYIGKLGKKLFLLFCWLFCILVVAAFADVVAGTFKGFTVDEAGAVTKIAANGAVATTWIFPQIYQIQQMDQHSRRYLITGGSDRAGTEFPGLCRSWNLAYYYLCVHSDCQCRSCMGAASAA